MDWLVYPDEIGGVKSIRNQQIFRPSSRGGVGNAAPLPSGRERRLVFRNLVHPSRNEIFLSFLSDIHGVQVPCPFENGCHVTWGDGQHE